MSKLLPSLRALRVFMSVAQSGSISKSAELIYRAPSALTRSIRDLEACLDAELFERKARGMLLTSCGEAVLRRAEQIREELLDGWCRLGEAGHTLRGAEGGAILAGLFNRKKLSLFVDLADHQHMPAVAKLHGVSQPAVSMAIRELEHALGVRLFDRTAKGIILTGSGDILVCHARRALAILKLIRQDLAALRGNIEGRVTIGALPLGRTMILPTAIAQLVTQHPKLSIQTIESPYEVLATGLRNGDIDFIFGAIRPHGAALDFDTESLFTDEISLVARLGHPLTKKRVLSMHDLLDAKWVLSRPGTPACETVARAFANAGFDAPSPVVATGDLAILRCLLLQSDLITAISAHQLLYEIADGKLQTLDFHLEGTAREIGITTRTGAKSSPAATCLIREIRLVIAMGGATPPQTGTAIACQAPAGCKPALRTIQACRPAIS